MFKMDITEAQPGVNTNPNTTSPQTRRAHCDAQDSDAPQCMETDVSENTRNCLSKSAWHMWPVMSAREGVTPLTKEECLQAKPHGESKKHGSFKQRHRCRGGKLKGRRGQLTRRWKPLQPVGGVGRAPEKQSHQRDDQAVVRASDGERERVKSHMSEAWTGEVLTRTRRQQCVKLSSNTAKTMAISLLILRTGHSWRPIAVLMSASPLPSAAPSMPS